MRFGVIQRKRPKHFHRHGEVVFFRQPCRHRERFWIVVICLLVMVGQAIGLDRLAAEGEPAFSQWIGPLGTSMFFPMMFIFFALIMPQRSLLISPKGVCVASTFRRRRRWMRWDEVTAVTPSLHMIRSRTGRPLMLNAAQLPKPVARERHAELKQRLAPHFDFKHPTTYARHLARIRRRFSVAWLLDGLALWGAAALFLGMNAGKLFCRTNPALAFAIVGLGGAFLFVLVRRQTRRIERDHWIPRRAVRGASNAEEQLREALPRG